MPKSVNQYLGHEWDYVITVCGGANESCPMFTGKVKTDCTLDLRPIRSDRDTGVYK